MQYVDAYMFPCPTCGNAAGQVQAAVAYLKQYNCKYGMFWLDIEGPQYWMDPVSNQAFLNELIAEVHNQGQTLGIYTSASQWGPIFGENFSVGSPPLWYANVCAPMACALPPGRWRPLRPCTRLTGAASMHDSVCPRRMVCWLAV